ncbi:hypothetical protein ACX3YG_23765 [Pseudomonas wadenswilerensis]
MNSGKFPKASGDLDVSFGNNGIAAFPIDLNIAQSVKLNDGKVLTSGSEMYGTSLILNRHLETGEIDTSFGDQGLVRITLPWPGEVGAFRLWPTSDDSVLLTGAVGNPLHGSAFVVRVLPDGELDSSFGVSGYCIIALEKPSTVILSAGLQSDGKFVLSLVTSDSATLTLRNYLARLDNGHLDPSFGPNGSGLVRVDEDLTAGLLILPTDGILVGSSTFGYSQIIFRQYLANGEPDTHFGENGEVSVAIENGSVWCGALLLQPDGKIVAVGSASVGFGIHSLITRLDPDGGMDMTFNGGEPKIMVFQGHETQNMAVALQPDNKLVTGGESTGTVETHNFVLMRFLSNGNLDSSFGNNGQVMTDFSGLDTCNKLDLQSDGKILASGVSVLSPLGPYYILARYLG